MANMQVAVDCGVFGVPRFYMGDEVFLGRIGWGWLRMSLWLKLVNYLNTECLGSNFDIRCLNLKN